MEDTARSKREMQLETEGAKGSERVKQKTEGVQRLARMRPIENRTERLGQQRESWIERADGIWLRKRMR